MQAEVDADAGHERVEAFADPATDFLVKHRPRLRRHYAPAGPPWPLRQLADGALVGVAGPMGEAYNVRSWEKVAHLATHQLGHHGHSVHSRTARSLAWRARWAKPTTFAAGRRWRIWPPGETDPHRLDFLASSRSP
jgi:hypothetical protein